MILDYRQSEVAVITNSDIGYRDDDMTINDNKGRPLLLRIKYSNKLSLGGRKVSIYSPYVLLNKTGLEMFYSATTILATTRYAAGQGSEKSKRKDQVEPFMFSYSNFEPLRSRAIVKIADSDWTRAISFEAVGVSYDVAAPVVLQNAEINIGVTVKEGDGKYFLTKVVTFTPRFILTNHMKDDLLFRQHGQTSTLAVKPEETLPMHYLRPTHEKHLNVKLSGLIDEWSNAFSINQIGAVYVKVGKKGSEEESLIKTEIMLEGATVFLTFSKEEGRWPIRIDNLSDQDIVVWQQVYKTNLEL